MDIQSNISNNIKKHRKALELSQEALAEELGITSQAVSKWECMQSIPDIEAMIALCSLFGISLDKLILDKETETVCEEQKANRKNAYYFDSLPDDGALRVLQFKGKRLLREDEFDPDLFIPLAIECGEQIDVHVVGSAHVDGDIGGDLRGTTVTCGDVAGDVKGVSVSCGDVAGDVASTHVTCNDVAGDVSSTALTCNDVVAVKNCVSVTCDSVVTIEHCERDITCDDVGTIERCEGNITCDNIDTVENCNGDIHCDSVDTIERCGGTVYIG